jgi:hypothetical protein
MAKNPKPVKHRLKRLSLYPLKPEEALEAFMKVNPERVEAKLKRAGTKKR